jgi:YbbR domain-containing protein
MVAAIRRNFALKMLALFLAIVGWAYFRFSSNGVFGASLSVPIAAVNLQAGYIARFTDKTAIVTIQPKPGEPAVKSDEIKAVLDLSNRSPGVYNVPLQIVSPDVQVQSQDPSTVTLTIEKIDRKTFPVAMHYGGQANVVVTHFTLSPASVTVTGPTSDLSQVATVRVDMPLSASQTSRDEMIRPVAVNSSGEEIGDVQVTPNLVRVQAQFAPATKEK